MLRARYRPIEAPTNMFAYLISLVEVDVIYVIGDLIGRFKTTTCITRGRDSSVVGKAGKVYRIQRLIQHNLEMVPYVKLILMQAYSKGATLSKIKTLWYVINTSAVTSFALINEIKWLDFPNETIF